MDGGNKAKMTKKQVLKRKDNSMKHTLKYDPLLIQIQNERNIKTSTMQGYYSSLLTYLDCTGFNNLQEMVEEALEDEKNRIPLKEARISEHLREYRNYLNTHFKNSNTIHTYFSKLETFYRHFQVTVPKRPPMKIKQDYHVSYFDLPTKKMIQIALNQSGPMMKSVILFMSSSGTAKNETLSITVGMFIDGLREYTDLTHPRKVLFELKDRKDIVPVIFLERIKTNNPYYTCCSPEATDHIFKYLNTRKTLEPEEKLFPITGSYLMKQFQIINDRNEWGFVGPYRRFRSHTLRKFHASNLGCSSEIVDALEGRSPTKVHQAYIKQNPKRTKKQYIEYMHNVMINTSDYIGPHLGGMSEKEKMKNTLTELVPDLVPTLEQLKGGVQPQVMAQPQTSHHDAGEYHQCVKDIGKLELRIESLEEKIEAMTKLLENI